MVVAGVKTAESLLGWRQGLGRQPLLTPGILDATIRGIADTYFMRGPDDAAYHRYDFTNI